MYACPKQNRSQCLCINSSGGGLYLEMYQGKQSVIQRVTLPVEPIKAVYVSYDFKNTNTPPS
jgi:hypothetical protein